MNSFFAPGAKRTRFLVAFGLSMLLAAPAMLIWASKAQRFETPNEDQFELLQQKNEGQRLATVQLPSAEMPPAEFSPFGGAFTPRRYSADKAAGTLFSPLGDTDWDANKDDLLAKVKPGLRWGAAELTNGMRPGLNLLQMSQSAIDSQGLDAVMATVSQGATVLSILPRRTLLVNVEANDMHTLRQSNVVERVVAYQPIWKFANDFGGRPQIMKAAAHDENIRALVTLVPGTDTSAMARSLSSIQGISEVSETEFGGQIFLRVRPQAFDKLAREERVLRIDPVRDMMLFNAENVPTIQAGSAEDSNFIRPFDQAGVDGGGIDTNADGRRINNGTDAVPPQIVAVVDNGISLDTPNFAQTATQVTTIPAPIGPAHRKVQAVQVVAPAGDGATCDSPLSGGATHGNTVAAAIAAYPSELGFFATRSGIGGSSQPRSENLDGIARGARILVEDAAGLAQCTVNTLVEKGGNVTPGALTTRLNLAICPGTGGVGACAGITGGGTENHLAVLPFGAPSNFSLIQFQVTDGTYPQEAVDVDTFLYNNRDYMVTIPVGNNGGLIGSNRLALSLRVIPDLFNGTALDDDPNFAAAPIQVPPPATAKNIISVGSTTADFFTFFGSTDGESTINAFTSRGPATPESLRAAPIVMAPAFDFVGTPYTSAVAVFRSNDNDNLAPIDAQLDEGNFGSSYSAAYMSGAGAIIRDYFAQGFYPSGDRVTGDRVANVSGSLVKAALVASADFNEGGIGTQGQELNERNLRRTRCLDLGTVTGIGGSVNVGVMCNSEQGFGRPVLTQVLPLANWSDDFVLHPVFPNVHEYPASGLLVFDRIATGEGLINNTTTSITHNFTVTGSHVISKTTSVPVGARALTNSILRVAVAWPDLPSPAGSGGPLINDLDLTVESPGPDNCLVAGETSPVTGAACPAGSATDNIIYDGNNYNGGTNNALIDQWSKGRLSTDPVVHEKRNPVEAVHLTGNPNNDQVPTWELSPLYIGHWRATVKRGVGGAVPGSITIPTLTVAQDADQNEDDNANGRLDAGEDNNGNGLLDQPGQPFSLVISGPVFLAEAAPPAGPTNYPISSLNFDQSRYSCAASAILSILDTTGTGTPAISTANTTFQVLNAAGAVIDSESGIGFVAGATAAQTLSVGLPIRLAALPVTGNGILEGDTGATIVATYARAGQRAMTARAGMSCSPDLVAGAFLSAGGNAIGDQTAINGGCDDDENLDAGEVVTYGIALVNRSRTDNYADLTATLTPSGPGAGAVSVIDSPKNIGSLPGNALNSVFFHVQVNAAAANALSVANRVVNFTLTLDSLVRGQRVNRQTYAFTNAINSDRETFYYSTDHLAGGRELRDINRNLTFDKPDVVDPFLGFITPREDVTFASLFTGSGAPAGAFTNNLGEDLNNNGVLDGAERDILPNGTLDKGILSGAVVNTALDKAPFHFDINNGGFVPFRHPGSNPSLSISSNPVWEYKTSGLCGFQTSGAAANQFGIWHTGDGDPTTPIPAATVCENHAQPGDNATPTRTELIMDVLESPIIAKVNQNNDSRNFPYTVEFQRLGYNENIQLVDGYAGGGLNIDNNVDSDNANSLLGQPVDQYYTRRTGGWPYGVLRDAGQYFDNGKGIDPGTVAPFQRTFGPFVDVAPVGTISPGDNGFTGNTQDTNLDSSSPIPEAGPDFLAYPVPSAPDIGICDGGTSPGITCNPLAPVCPGGGACTSANTLNGGSTSALNISGPIRNLDVSLIGYEGGFASVIDPAPQENYFFFNPGRAGNRWQVGIGFWAVESTSTATDYGKSIDDVVFEWKEYHPRNELRCVGGATPGADCATNADCGAGTCTGGTPACSRFGGVGQPAGNQCATITADRTNLFECDEGLEITVYDDDPPATALKCVGGPTPGAVCATSVTCGAGGFCNGVDVQVVTNSDAVSVNSQGGVVLFPNTKKYNLAPVASNPGLFRGTVIFSTTTNDARHVFTVPGSDGNFSVYYHDQNCDSDRDGQADEDDFNNVDGDGIGAGDNCPFVYNPGQADTDADGADGVGNACDNCPDLSNADQADANADGVGDACEDDDVDQDGVDNQTDTCPDILNNGAVGPHGKDIRCDNNGVTGVCTAGFCSAPAWNAALNYGPGPVKTARPCVANSDCNLIDRDYDAVPDYLDNCVDTYNPTQLNVDGDSLGDACDDDCLGRNHLLICRANPFNTGCAGACASAPGVCGGGGTCLSPVPSAGKACATNADCTYTTPSTVGTSVGGANCVPYVRNSGTCAGGPNAGAACDDDFACGYPAGSCARNCSFENDDFDVDGVEDSADNCATVVNLPIIPGTKRQADSDNDGIGDICDPAGTFDDALDGLPDDVLAFNGNIVCRTQPLASFAILSANYQDLDGDHDIFPDTGETGRVQLTIKNAGPALTDATVVMTSSDPDVACITQPAAFIGNLGAGAQVTIGDFVAGNPGFTMTSSNSLLFLGPPDPAPHSTICFTVVANETLGVAAPICVDLLSDLNLPAGPPPSKTLGPDGILGTADDGITFENFDIDKNGDGVFTVADTFRDTSGPGTYTGYCNTAPLQACATSATCPLDGGGGPGICYTGMYIRGNSTGIGAGSVAAVSCGGYDEYDGAGTPQCILDPDFPMDWHFHCPNGALDCPNLETGTCVGGCTYDTPANGAKWHSGVHSLHMGAHFDANDSQAGDSTHLRALQGFQSAPMNLTVFPGGGDLELSFFHIARLMDNNGVGPGNERQCVDCGDVQIRTDGDAAPTVDNWGFWNKLVPFENIYDHKPNAFSVFGSYYCEFTPTDAGPDAAAAYGVKETICYPLGAWSRCGSTTATTAAQTGDCAGPGEVDPSGVGVWVKSRFNLAGYLGQRIEIRWVAETWVFDANSSSYFEIGPGWNNTTADDGWWLDDIRITGTVAQQFTPQADLAPRVGTCPGKPCNQAVGDAGTNVVLKITDLNGTVLTDTNFATTGQSIRVSAIDSTLPGLCVGGVPEYEFTKDGVVVQSFGPKTYYLDAPEQLALYSCKARCSTDFTCTSVIGATIQVNPYTGDGSDAYFANGSDPNVGIRYFRGACALAPNAPCNELAECPGAGNSCNLSAIDTTRFSACAVGAGGACPGGGGCLDFYSGTVNGEAFWNAPPQAPLPAGKQSYRLGSALWGAHLPKIGLCGPPAAVGTRYQSEFTTAVALGTNPAIGSIFYYTVNGHNKGTGVAQNTISNAFPRTCEKAGFCSNVTTQGCDSTAECTAPGTCNAVRTCFGGPLNGTACLTDAACDGAPGDGDCRAVSRTFCSTDTGAPGLGGCGTAIPAVFTPKCLGRLIDQTTKAFPATP